MDAEPRHLLAHPGVAHDRRGGPEHEKPLERRAAYREVDSHGGHGKGERPGDIAKRRREAVGAEERQQTEGSDRGEEPGAGAAAQAEVQQRRSREGERQELVGRQKHHVVEVRLVAPRLIQLLLAQPVVQRLPDAASETAGVGEEGGVQQGVRDIEGGGHQQPDAPVPAQTDDGRGGQQRQHRGYAYRLLPAQRVELVADRLQRQLDARGELRQGQRAQDDEEIGGGVTFPQAQALAQASDDGPQSGDRPCPGQVQKQVGHRRRHPAQTQPATALSGQIGGQPQVEEDEQHGDVDKRVLFSGEAQPQQGGAQIQKQRLPLIYVAPETDDDAQSEHSHVDVVAGEAAEVQQRGREGDQPGGEQRSHPAQPVAEEEG